MKNLFIAFCIIIVSLPNIAFTQWVLINKQLQGISNDYTNNSFVANDSFLFCGE